MHKGKKGHCKLGTAKINHKKLSANKGKNPKKALNSASNFVNSKFMKSNTNFNKLEDVEEEKEIQEVCLKKSVSTPNIISKDLFSISKVNSLFTKETPTFKQRSFSEDNSKQELIEEKPVCYDTPDRYLYEFYNQKGFNRFRRNYMKALKRKYNKNTGLESIEILGDPNK